MSGRGKGGKRRLEKKSNVVGISSSSIRRLARRAGVSRISGLIYPTTHGIIKSFVTTILQDAIAYCKFRNRKIVKTADIISSLKHNNRTLFGYGS